MQFTVILNTFNRAHFLPRVLAAWTRVRGPNFSMLIADDGSEDGTRELIEKIGPDLPFPLLHVSHENRGHRRAEILNKAVHLAQDEALLFTDADSLPAENLLRVYADRFNGRELLCGGYLRLSEQYSSGLDIDAVRDGEFELQMPPSYRRWLEWYHRKQRVYTWLHWRRRPHVMGLNMCLPRSGFLKVNGYDNNFQGWGRADGDLRERLKRIGVRARSVWNKAIIFHMYHPPDCTKAANANDAYSRRKVVSCRPESGFEQVRPQVVYSNRAELVC